RKLTVPVGRIGATADGVVAPETVTSTDSVTASPMVALPPEALVTATSVGAPATTCDTDALAPPVWAPSPLYVAVTACVPDDRACAVQVAVPEAVTATVAASIPPSRKVTVPVTGGPCVVSVKVTTNVTSAANGAGLGSEVIAAKTAKA